jgi:hypothetical protein
LGRVGLDRSDDVRAPQTDLTHSRKATVCAVTYRGAVLASTRARPNRHSSAQRPQRRLRLNLRRVSDIVVCFQMF